MSVEISNIVFSAGHFLVGSQENLCERLHGHNYKLKAQIHGNLTENFMIADFRVLKKMIKNVCSKYDHRVLLPGKSKFLQVLETDDTIRIKVHKKEYTFPKEDVLILPISNTTTEELSRLLCEEIASKIREIFSNVDVVEIFIEEIKGQGAWYRKILSDLK
jgi:6-pyruvoyltetrahydropterin/6-carboxytetrahydropterin synthase